MIKRERWIVYPLLFLVISISLKDKLNSAQKNLQLKNLKVDQLEAGRITTPSIQGGNANFREMAGALIQGRQLQVVDAKGIPKVVLHMAPTMKDNQPNFEKPQGGITLRDEENQEMLILGGGAGGGFVAARSTTQPQDFVAFGYQAGRIGMFWLDDNGNPQGFFKPKPRVPATKKTETKEDVEKEEGKKANNNEPPESTQNTTPNP